MKSANVEQLAEVLARPTPEEERVLRGYFGEEAYCILAGLAAQQRGSTRGVRGPLFDERAFLRRVEESNAEELAEILRQPSVDEERALRIHLGDDRFQPMHALALGRGTTRGATRTKGNVIVIPGIIGSEMTAVDRRGSGDPIWLNVLRIMAGRPTPSAPGSTGSTCSAWACRRARTGRRRLRGRRAAGPQPDAVDRSGRRGCVEGSARASAPRE